MKAHLKKALTNVAHALASKQARPAEIALARIILGALGVKLGYDLEQYLH